MDGKKITVAATLKYPDPQQVFTHVDNIHGKARTFLIETMMHFVHDYPTCAELVYTMAPIDKKLADYLRANAGIEQHRVDRLVEPYLSAPCMGILWEDGATTMVDGNHRIVRNVDDGKTAIKCVLFKFPFWEHFLMPEDFSRREVENGCLTNHSNIGVKDVRRRN